MYKDKQRNVARHAAAGEVVRVAVGVGGGGVVQDSRSCACKYIEIYLAASKRQTTLRHMTKATRDNSQPMGFVHTKSV